MEGVQKGQGGGSQSSSKGQEGCQRRQGDGAKQCKKEGVEAIVLMCRLRVQYASMACCVVLLCWLSGGTTINQSEGGPQVGTVAGPQPCSTETQCEALCMYQVERCWSSAQLGTLSLDCVSRGSLFAEPDGCLASHTTNVSSVTFVLSITYWLKAHDQVACTQGVQPHSMSIKHCKQSLGYVHVAC